MKSYSSVSIMKSRKCLQFCHCKYISCGSLKTSVCAARNALRKQGLIETQVTPTPMLVPEIGPALPENPKPRGTCAPGYSVWDKPWWTYVITCSSWAASMAGTDSECFSKQMLLLACCFNFSFSESIFFFFFGKFYFKNRGILGILK